MAQISSRQLKRITVLAEPARLDIMLLISAEGTCCASDILTHFDFSQPTLSHHMSVLLENDLVEVTKKGRFMYYSINKGSMLELAKILELLGSENKVSVISGEVQEKRENAPRAAESLPEKKPKKKKKSEKKKKEKKKKK